MKPDNEIIAEQALKIEEQGREIVELNNRIKEITTAALDVCGSAEDIQYLKRAYEKRCDEQQSRINELEVERKHFPLFFNKEKSKPPAEGIKEIQSLREELEKAKEDLDIANKKAVGWQDLSGQNFSHIKELEAERGELKRQYGFLEAKYGEIVAQRREGALLGQATMEEAYNTITDLKNRLQESDSRAKETAIGFGDWIGKKSLTDTWFKFGWQGWYDHMTGHITTDQLFTKYQDSLKEKQ